DTFSTNQIGCPNCRKEITIDQLKEIFPDASLTHIEQVAKTYTQYMTYFSLDTCRKKAYFFAAASVETGTSIIGKFGTTEENMNYSRMGLLSTFPTAFFDGKWGNPKKRTNWISSVYTSKPTDKNYAENQWYATVERGDKTLYIYIEDTRIGYQNRIFKTKTHWNKVVEIDRIPDNTREKSLLTARYAYWYKNGNQTEADGENYRGSGLIQLTGKGIFTEVQEIIKHILNPSLIRDITTKEGSELVRTNLEVGTLTSMGYFSLNKLNALINEFPRDGQRDTDTEALEIWAAIGRNTGTKGQDSYTKKTKSYKEKASQAFKVPQCTAHQVINPSVVSDAVIITYEINYNSIGFIKKTVQKEEKIVLLYIKKIIPKEGNNKNPDYCKYVYIDKRNQRHEICVLRFKTIKEVYLDKNKKTQVDPDKTVAMIDYILAFKGYESADGSLAVGFNRDNSKEGRRYAVDIDCFAALLGAMCDENIDCISFNGASNFRGYPTPSSSHINGRVFDVGYIPKNGKIHQTGLTLADTNFDVERQKLFNQALYKYGFARDQLMLSERFTYQDKIKYVLPHCRHYNLVAHDNHLHIQGYSRKESIIDEQRT
ncbi:hypothetical protein, partial [Myroides odoratus]|uniref:hypothetical protein n=1 Tax=Myroides odoratus TaxID=256 RepID=UPI0039AFCDC0